MIQPADIQIEFLKKFWAAPEKKNSKWYSGIVAALVFMLSLFICAKLFVNPLWSLIPGAVTVVFFEYKEPHVWLAKRLICIFQWIKRVLYYFTHNNPMKAFKLIALYTNWRAYHVGTIINYMPPDRIEYFEFVPPRAKFTEETIDISKVKIYRYVEIPDEVDTEKLESICLGFLGTSYSVPALTTWIPLWFGWWHWPILFWLIILRVITKVTLKALPFLPVCSTGSMGILSKLMKKVIIKKATPADIADSDKFVEVEIPFIEKGRSLGLTTYIQLNRERRRG